jgi:alanine racemase
LEDRFDPWIEVEAAALVHNISEIRRLTDNRPILAVIKNNAYGLELTTTAGLLEPMPEIAGFAVVKADAAIALKEAGVRKPVHLMAMFPESLAPELARLGVVPCLYSEDALRFIEPMVQVVGGPVDVQVYLDTGMSRMGIPYHKALPWLESIVGSGMVRLQGMFMGFTEDPEYDREQLRRFLSVASQAADAGFPVGTLHAASSSGVFELPEAHLDMVRPGLAIFGGYPNDPIQQSQKATLRSAVSLKARVVRVQELRVGDSVSYGRNYVAQEPTWVATIPAGHTDGYPRTAVEGGRVLIGDEAYRAIGAVSASHTIVELGSSPSVAVGDVATLIGSAAEEVDPNWLSAGTGTSVYDIFMHLNPLLPRVVV